jgi:hypothetical protein
VQCRYEIPGADREELLDALLDAASHDAGDFFAFAIERAGVPEDLLGFAGIEPVEVDAVPLELQVAEKLHAYTRTYEGGRTSTRPKDLVDLALISELSQLDAATLSRAIDTIFALRDTHAAPKTLPSPPAEWATPFRRLAEEVGLPPELTTGHRDAATLLDPILAGEVAAGRWERIQRRWAAGKSNVGRSSVGR